MVKMEIWKRTWNKKYEYNQPNLEKRETLKFKEALEVLQTLKKHTEKFNFGIEEVVFYPRYYNRQTVIRTTNNVSYHFKFTDKQRTKINELLVDLNNGNEVEEIWGVC